MRNSLYVVVGLFILVVLIGSVPCSLATDSAATGALTGVVGGAPDPADQATDEASAILYPVTLTFNPSSIVVPPGGSSYVSLSVHNSGTLSFHVTRCKATARWSNGVKQKINCGIIITTSPGATLVINPWGFTVPYGAPWGKSVWTIILVGTVGRTKAKSGKGLETIYVGIS